MKQGSAIPHISVCVCTYKRPDLLRKTLRELARQETRSQFTFSIVVIDNDALRSAEAIVNEFRGSSPINVVYEIETQQNIALARNRAVAQSRGEFLAFIDDDEFPIQNWLSTLFENLHKYQSDGVLGPVKPYYDEHSPKWVIKGRFYDRATYPTGLVIDWRKGRTGNVLLKTKLFESEAVPFNPEFRNGEDQDFFRRMIEKGHVFVWCDEAVAFEAVPPVRCKRRVMIRRALLRGSMEPQNSDFGFKSLMKSSIAVPVYCVALPFALLVGQHRFMNLAVRMFDHLGKLLAAAGFNPIKDPYVTN